MVHLSSTNVFELVCSLFVGVIITLALSLHDLHKRLREVAPCISDPFSVPEWDVIAVEPETFDVQAQGATATSAFTCVWLQRLSEDDQPFNRFGGFGAMMPTLSAVCRTWKCSATCCLSKRL